MSRKITFLTLFLWLMTVTFPFFNDTATTEIYTLSLHDALPIYLSAYIKTTYKMTFREWITGLRLEYAKNMLKEHPEINIQKLAESSGFLSRSNFIKLFSEKEGCTPAKWKKANRE